MQVERVGDGLLISFTSGATIHFEAIGDAQQFASNILMVCAFGKDQLDHPPTN